MTVQQYLPKHGRFLLAAVVITLFCTACSAPVRVPMKVDVSLSDDLNNDQPLPVDVVIVCQDNREEALARIDSKTWFSQGRTRYQGLAAKDPDIELYSWEWVPGQALPDGITLKSHRRCSIFIFADYSGAGRHKATLKGHKPFRLELSKNDFRATPIKGRKLKPKAKKAKN